MFVWANQGKKWKKKKKKAIQICDLFATNGKPTLHPQEDWWGGAGAQAKTFRSCYSFVVWIYPRGHVRVKSAASCASTQLLSALEDTTSVRSNGFTLATTRQQLQKGC